MMQVRTVLIAGPTASGKSAAALGLAEAIGGEIVNADAIQVYRDLRVLSARPTPAEEARAPHHLFGHVDAATRYSAGGWARDAAAAIADIQARGRAAIIVGGTGLYFHVLEAGLSPAPAVPEEVSRRAQAHCAAIGLAAFRAEILAFDPAMARLDPGDRQRHIRAYEVFHASGRPLSEVQKAAGAPIIGGPDIRIVIEPPRAALYAAIERRFDAMLAEGGLDEARALLARRLDPRLPAMKALGSPELIAHLAGTLTLAEAIDLAKRNTRRFAKRQLTWFRNQTSDWRRATSAEDAAAMALGVASLQRRG